MQISMTPFCYENKTGDYYNALSKEIIFKRQYPQSPWHETKCPPMDERLEAVACMNNGISFSHEKNETLTFAAEQMELERII